MKLVMTITLYTLFSFSANASDYYASTARAAAVGVAQATSAGTIDENSTTITTESLNKGQIYKVEIGNVDYVVTINAIYPEEGVCTVVSVNRLN